MRKETFRLAQPMTAWLPCSSCNGRGGRWSSLPRRDDDMMCARTGLYHEARELVATGDVVLVRSGWFHSPLAAATKLLLRTPYTHASIALWLDGGLWVSEMWANGNVLVPLSQYAKEDWDVFDCPVVDRDAVKRGILKHMRDEVRYDFADLLRIAAHRRLGLPLPKADGERMVCSGYVAHVLLEYGWEVDMPSVAAPSDLHAALVGRLKLEYRCLT